MQEKTVQISREKRELSEFKKKHSKAFLYFLEEYEKWIEVRKNFEAQKQ